MFVMVFLSVSTPSKLFFVLCVFLHMEVFECMLACVAALRGGVGTERGGERGGGGPGYLSAEVVARSQNISVSITWDKALIHCVIQKLDWNF
jgi:hypothetical protein